MGCASSSLSADLAMLGFQVERLKTGTSPRVNGRSIDFSVCEIQPGDSPEALFSYRSRDILKRDSEPFCTLNTWGDENFRMKQMPCWITYTNQTTHDIIRKNLKFSPLYSGIIEGVGPRYCPSIEDKIVRFAEKNSHQVFLEPEGRSTEEFYLNGVSTSLPYSAQCDFIHTIPGLENAQLIRPGYAVEYDFCPPTQLHPTLETKLVENLYFAGQINGTSGYEEAAGQGLMAGINAALKNQGKEGLVLDRSQAYIGVMIDDLTTKGTSEPYRLLTSRAEYRLLLRHDNARRRLARIGHAVGALPEASFQHFLNQEKTIEDAVAVLKNTHIKPGAEISAALAALNAGDLEHGTDAYTLLRRPNVSLDLLQPWTNLQLTPSIASQIEIECKYEGYIEKARRDVARMEKLESVRIPRDTDFDSMANLALEARSKLSKIRPATLGQASRISGINPSDIAVLSAQLMANREPEAKPVSKEHE